MGGPEAEPAMLEVSLLTGELVVKLEVATTCHVHEVKQMIASREGTPTWMQRLSIGDKELLDSEALQNYGFFEGQHVCVRLSRSARFLPLDAFKEAPIPSNLCLQNGQFLFCQGEHGLGYYAI